MTLLPRIDSFADYKPIYTKTEPWLPAARAICRRHGLDAADLRRAGFGTHIVFFTGDRVVKLFCELWHEDFVAERAMLANVSGLPTPQLDAVGEIEGWPYLVMSRVDGTPARTIWGTLDASAKADVVEQLGRIMRALHETSPVPELARDWDGFLAERVARLDAHHKAGGERWQRRIREHLGGFSEPPFEPVPLSADITDDHLLLSERNGRYEITGFIDFGDAMMGHPHYEFIAPLAFYTNGEPGLSRRLVEAYGWQPTDTLMERVTSYCLLHRYGHIGQYLERVPANDMREFAAGLWG